MTGWVLVGAAGLLFDLAFVLGIWIGYEICHPATAERKAPPATVTMWDWPPLASGSSTTNVVVSQPPDQPGAAGAGVTRVPTPPVPQSGASVSKQPPPPPPVQLPRSYSS